MTGRVVLAPDVLLAAVVVGPFGGDGPAVRRALRAWVEDDTEILVAAAAWPTMLDALGARGWPASRIVEALHALDGLDLRTVEIDLPALLLAADAMERHGVAAPMAAALVLAELENASLASLDPRVVDAAAHGIVVGGTADDATVRLDPVGRKPSGGPTVADYRGLGGLLGELRRVASEAAP